MQVPPAVHDTHVPAALHTRLVPQPVPAARCMSFTHVCAPVEQLVRPVKHAAFGLLEHDCPAEHTTHWPVLLHT